MIKYCRSCGQELTLTRDKTCRNCGAKPTRATAFCRYCGHTTDVRDVVCPTCGAAIRPIGNIARLFGQKNQKLVKLGIVVNLSIVVALISLYVVLSIPKWMTRQIKSVASDVIMQSTGYNGLPLTSISVFPPSIPEADGPRKALHAVQEDFTPEGVPQNTTYQLSVFALYKNTTLEEITDQVIYKSGNEVIATVTTSGLVTAVSSGTTNITVFYTAMPGSDNISSPSAGKTPVTLNVSVSIIVQ